MPDLKTERKGEGLRSALLVLAGAAFYATARYNIFKGVPWSDWPIYTVNKAFALAGLILLVLAVIRQRFSSQGGIGRIVHMAGLFIAIHVLLSVCLLHPSYFEKYFQLGKLTFAAGLSMTLGAIAMAVMVSGSKSGTELSPDKKNKKLAVLAFASGLHAALLGYAGWFTPALWPGRLVPITLISFLLGVTAVAVVARPKPGT